jgi:glycerol uptake facilitator protein
MQKEPSLAQKLIAEFIGTALLTLIGAGSVTATLTLAAGSKAPFSEADLGIISFAFAFIIMAMIFAIGKISGCHINPAVTIALALTGRVDWGTGIAYIVAQFVGGIVGALGIVAMFGSGAASTSILGVTSYGPAVSPLQAIVAEAIGTFILVFTIYGVAVDPRAPAGWAALGIGLIVAGVIFVVGPVTGAALNPARAFGTTFVQAIFGGKAFFNQYYVYVIGPVVGGALGALVYDFLAQPKAAAEQPAAPNVSEPAAVTSR